MSQNVIQKLGEQIAFYRKKAGLTQSALAEKLSVSTQAVSRWERGGSPDAAVLPALADALQVSIDQLYGLPSGQHADIAQLLMEEFKQIPKEEIFNVAYRYSFTILKAALGSYEQSGESFHKLLETHENIDRHMDTPAPPPYQVYFHSDLGIMSASIAKDFQFFFMMPDPVDGFASVMKEKEAYLYLFQFLTQEHRLDMLLLLYGENREGFTASKAAADLTITEALAEEILQEMYNLNFVQMMQFASAGGKVTVYKPGTSMALIPFLYFGAELMVSSGTCWLGYYARTKPFLTAPLGTNGVDTGWVTKRQRIGGDV